MIEPLIDRAYVDLESKQLARVAPAPAFGALMNAAARRTRRWRSAVGLLDEGPIARDPGRREFLV